MKANELRIGNWIHDPIHNEDDVQLSDTMFCAFLSDWKDELKPIPLTEEWLLKLGFELETWVRKNYFSDETSIINGYVIDSIWCFMPRQNNKMAFFGRRILQSGFKEKEIWSFSEREGIHSRGDDNRIIIYVHTLQNLYFALTGIELKILVDA